MFVKREDMEEKKIHLKIEIKFAALEQRKVHCDNFSRSNFRTFCYGVFDLF